MFDVWYWLNQVRRCSCLATNMEAVENGRNSNFEGLVTLTLTLDRVILHTIVHHLLTSTYTPNCIEIEETFCEWTHGRTFETGFKECSN